MSESRRTQEGLPACVPKALPHLPTCSLPSPVSQPRAGPQGSSVLREEGVCSRWMNPLPSSWQPKFNSEGRLSKGEEPGRNRSAKAWEGRGGHGVQGKREVVGGRAGGPGSTNRWAVV